MNIGVNWSSPQHLPVVKALLKSGAASFCEILIDNFLHLAPSQLRDVFADTPVAFHIMNSRFIQRDPEALAALAARLKPFIATLEPMYVSDHLAQFTCEGRLLPFIFELDYERQFKETARKVELWQNLLEVSLHLENFPSALDGGLAQPAFLARLSLRTGASILFDFSNAVVAARNCGLGLEAWNSTIARSRHFHAAGYALSDTQPPLVRDSHDGELAEDTLSFIKRSKKLLNGGGGRCSLVIERDSNVLEGSWAKDLSCARKALA
ncbi:MAG: DUF692 family multinuclear iron-containing protein [Elusimicrobiota bacterium]